MNALVREQLVRPVFDGEQPFRWAARPSAPWVVALAAGCLGVLGLAVAGPVRSFATLMTSSVAVWVSLVESARAVVAVWDAVSTVGQATAAVVARPEAFPAAAILAVLAACSLAALRRLLGTETESSPW